MKAITVSDRGKTEIDVRPPNVLKWAHKTSTYAYTRYIPGIFQSVLVCSVIHTMVHVCMVLFFSECSKNLPQL